MWKRQRDTNPPTQNPGYGPEIFISMPSTNEVEIASHTTPLSRIFIGLISCLAMANVAFLIAFSTEAWASASGITVGDLKGYYTRGLWKHCGCACDNTKTVGSWEPAAQAFACLTLIGLVAALVMLAVYKFMNVRKTSALLILTVICFITVILLLIAVSVYGTNVEGKNFIYGSGGPITLHLSWSFAAAVIGAMFCCAAGVLSAMMWRNSY